MSPHYRSVAASALNLQARRHQSNRLLFSIILAIVTATTCASANFFCSLHQHRIQHDSILRGAGWLQDLLHKHPDRIRNSLGVSQSSFAYISNLLQCKTAFCSLRHITADEQLGVFLYGVASNNSMRRIAERFQHSTSTIHRIYHRVMRFLIEPEIYNSIVCPVTADMPPAYHITSNRNFYPYFADCVGAVDKTHIPVSLSSADKALWRNRKGYTSQNILAVCNFDMNFTNVMYGWEGSVSDLHLWFEANRFAIIDIPQGKYVLGDAGFANCDSCLVPYRNVRYHVQEWAQGCHD